MSYQRCATSGTDNPSRTPWRYAHAAGIEGLHWDIYAGHGVDGWLVASVGTEADAARIVEVVNRTAVPSTIHVRAAVLTLREQPEKEPHP